ncbi:hypothetical protein CRI77_01960 [Mycolicibacterium duvalii]|uniref:Uncharacterized protein n=1 Tax=Mycolicibacterium duvalii TaxID=39688 RepID=A0A7I7K3Y2_9MYCO|nr:DUF559 domain-containing protein [Mycolicibacterium duvalii]MCV7367509.1 DUF559 domain-containing protein [Mycolicibacterium duvalii]PEG44163.1 hypothetical protein CRI77_01960 [Mycolicibacterium duvalii]BBX18900.1 hypothetical protein MDUV_37600 [Mycolicibacterium duvalii]
MRHDIIVASEALQVGQVTRRELARDYTKLFRNVYVRTGARVTARDKAVAAWLWSGRSATIAGTSAAALLGSRYLDGSAPAELIRTHRRAPAGVSVFSDTVSARDIFHIGDMPVTKPARTAFDIGRRAPLLVAVQRIDALLNATGCRPADVLAVIGRHPGARGVRRAQDALRLVDAGSESPPETLTRLFLVAAGLPRPETQIPVRGHGRLYRLDMGWQTPEVAVEYDGEQHWTDSRQRAHDIERLEFLSQQGWTIVRVSWAQLRDQPERVVERVASALGIAPKVQISHASLEECLQQVHTRRSRRG